MPKKAKRRATDHLESPSKKKHSDPNVSKTGINKLGKTQAPEPLAIASTDPIIEAVPTLKGPTSSGTEPLIEPNIPGQTSTPTAVTLDANATSGTGEHGGTSTEVAETVVEPVAHVATVNATTTEAIPAPAPTSLDAAAASNVAPDTADTIPTACTAIDLDLGVANVAASVKERIIKGLNFADSKNATYAIANVPPSATWGGGGAKNFVVDYDTQTAITVWVIGRLEFKSITSNGNLITISVKPFRSRDADAANLLARRLSQPQLRAAEAAYTNIRTSYYKSQYGPSKPIEDVFMDGTQGYDKSTMRKIDHESLKLGDIILVECLLKKYPRKANGQKTGSFGLSLETQVVALLQACSLQEHEAFFAGKEAVAANVAAAAVL